MRESDEVLAHLGVNGTGVVVGTGLLSVFVRHCCDSVGDQVVTLAERLGSAMGWQVLVIDLLRSWWKSEPRLVVDR
jgi:hypothetical protein